MRLKIMGTRLEKITKEAPDELDHLAEFRETLMEIMDVEPGLHPEVPENIHKAFRLVYSACEYAIQKNDGLVQALVEHAVNQQISEATYHRLLVSKGVFTPEEYQRILVDTTEKLGGLKAGTG
jgi:hypothetical protein